MAGYGFDGVYSRQYIHGVNHTYRSGGFGSQQRCDDRFAAQENYLANHKRGFNISRSRDRHDLVYLPGCPSFFVCLGECRHQPGIGRRCTQLNLPSSVFLIFVILLYLVLGCFIDGISMMILTLPLLFPIITEMGFNPIWFGVIMTLLIEMGQITPPMGVNLFTIHGIAGGTSISDVVMACIPYWFMLLVTVLLIILIPGLAVWLPQFMLE